MYKTGGKGAGLSNNRKAVLRFLSLYFFFLTGLVILYGTYIPCLMDYYIVRPEESYFTFFMKIIVGRLTRLRASSSAWRLRRFTV